MYSFHPRLIEQLISFRGHEAELSLCNVPIIEFVIANFNPDELAGKRVIEVGSKYVNGSVKPLLMKFYRPAEYIGVDREPGRNVDTVILAEHLTDHFGAESFDVVISTELIEHVLDWRSVINNFKTILRPNGILCLTTRSQGFPYHAYPYDFWRYEHEDFQKIFSDFTIKTLVHDPLEPGLFAKIIKPLEWEPTDLSGIEVYSMLSQNRISLIPNELAFTNLIQLFNQRPDLQERYPEVNKGDFNRLIIWADSVASRRSKDTAYSMLRPYTEWYSIQVIREKNTSTSAKRKSGLLSRLMQMK